MDAALRQLVTRELRAAPAQDQPGMVGAREPAELSQARCSRGRRGR